MIETIMHLFMFYWTRERAGVHGSFVSTSYPVGGGLIQFDIQGAPQGQATLFSVNLKPSNRQSNLIENS